MWPGTKAIFIVQRTLIFLIEFTESTKYNVLKISLMNVKK